MYQQCFFSYLPGKREGIYLQYYMDIRLNVEEKPTEQLRADLRKWIRREIGPIATPEYIQFADSLPKTRSGKIMRRVLRKIVSGQVDELGDLAMLADSSVIDDLVGEYERLTGVSSMASQKRHS